MTLRRLSAFCHAGHGRIRGVPPAEWDVLRGWRSVAARTLIVAGNRDPLFPARHSHEMYEAVEDAALWIVPNAGHESPFTEPTFGERALAFLTAQPEGRR